MRYLEILEQEEITGIICSQTVIMNVKQPQKTRKRILICVRMLV